MLACPILGAELGAGIALCQAPYRFVGLLSLSLLKTQYQRLRNNPQGHTDLKFEPKSKPVPFLQLRWLLSITVHNAGGLRGGGVVVGGCAYKIADSWALLGDSDLQE